MGSISRRTANLSLIFVTLVWGATFIVVKKSVEDLPPYPFLAVRFTLAFISMLPFVLKFKQYITRQSIFQGLGLGVVLFTGYASQTIGLQYTTASNAGFITGLSVVLVPAIVALTTKTLPRIKVLLGIISATFGLALLSIGPHFKLNYGDLIVLICAFGFATHIYLVGRYAPDANATILAAGQLLSVAILSSVATVLTPQPQISFTPYVWFGLLITAIPATSMAFFLQTKMQQFTSPTDTALIFSTEPVFSAIFAYLLAGEFLSTRGFIGAAFVLFGMLIAEFSGTEETLTESK